MKQVLLILMWSIAGVALVLSIYSFDYMFCSESRIGFFATLNGISAGLLTAVIFIEGLTFWLSSKTRTVWVRIVSLFICLTLVGYGIEASGFPNIHYAGTNERFARLAHNQPQYKIVLLALFFLPLIFWAYYALKRRTGGHKTKVESVY